jgi:RNA polymerase sigma-70 factor (ECF subfamily)
MQPGALKRERDVREAYSAHSGELYGFAVRSLGDAGAGGAGTAEVDDDVAQDREQPGPKGADLGVEAVAEGGIEPSVEPLEQALLSWQVEEAMRRIGEDHRHVLVETHYRGRPYAEVAAELGVPEGTVKSRVYYGLRALRVVLEEMGYEG